MRCARCGCCVGVLVGEDGRAEAAVAAKRPLPNLTCARRCLPALCPTHKHKQCVHSRLAAVARHKNKVSGAAGWGQTLHTRCVY
jgi:hypothetical protein